MAYYFLGGVGIGVVPLGSHEKNICVWTILVRIFGPSSRNSNPKLLFFFRFGRCIFFCLQQRPTSFKQKHNKKTDIPKRCFLSWRVSKMITDNTPSKTGESTKRLGWTKQKWYVFGCLLDYHWTIPNMFISVLFWLCEASNYIYMTALLFLSGLRMHPRHLQNPLAKCQAPRCHKTSLVDLEFHLQGRKGLYIYIYYMDYMCI